MTTLADFLLSNGADYTVEVLGPGTSEHGPGVFIQLVSDESGRASQAYRVRGNAILEVDDHPGKVADHPKRPRKRDRV